METMYSIEDVKRYNSRKGYHFFDVSSTRFFNSRYSGRVINAPEGVYFVTSERYDFDHKRLYTARLMTTEGSTSEAFDSTFQQFTSAAQAWRFIERSLGCVGQRAFDVRPKGITP